MKGFVFIAFCCFLFCTGQNTSKADPGGGNVPRFHHIAKALPVSDDNFLVVDEIEDEGERINNALARRFIFLPELSLSTLEIFDLTYLEGFYRDRLPLGDLPDIYITQRALRI